MLANWAGDAILSPQLVLRFACCARFALTLAFFGLMSARSASGAAVAPARPPVPSSGAWCWRRGARRARVSDGATLALHAGREIVRLGERASGARDGGRRSFGALTGREEKSLLERVSGGSGFERHMDSQSDRSCTRVALSSRAGTGTLLGCGKVYACTWRQRGATMARGRTGTKWFNGAHHGLEHCGPDCSSGVGPPTTPAGQA